MTKEASNLEMSTVIVKMTPYVSLKKELRKVELIKTANSAIELGEI